jgi:hypothetical protein
VNSKEVFHALLFGQSLLYQTKAVANRYKTGQGVEEVDIDSDGMFPPHINLSPPHEAMAAANSAGG